MAQSTKLPIYVQKKSLPMPGVDYELDLPRQHLSYSQISLYLKCPAQYYHRYVLGMASPFSVHFFEGTEQMAKYFTYTLTPVKGAAATVPSFDFVYFSPEKRGYIRKPIGLFELNVP